MAVMTNGNTASQQAQQSNQAQQSGRVMSPTKVIIPCRISYAHIWSPRSVMQGSDEKYSASLLIQKSDTGTLEHINKAIKAAIEDGKVKRWQGKVPPNLKLPLHDGDADRPDDENYRGCKYLNASSADAPQIVDRRKNHITDQSMVYSGCYCNVSVNFYAFSVNGNRGVAAGLGNVQFVRDGERLGGKASAEAEFDDLGDEVEVEDGGELTLDDYSYLN